jgi:lysophospholipase L1-like esterase
MRPAANTSIARRVARLALFGGGGAGALGAGMYGFLRFEGSLARRSIGDLANGAPHADGHYGASYPGEPLSFVVIGDSAGAGLGCDTPDETPGALLASGLAEIAERPVRLRTLAYSGARSEHLPNQVDDALTSHPDIALIIVGGNDVTHKVRPSTSAGYLDDALSRFHAEGARVVVGTCPDLGTIEPIPQPLRWIARRLSRQLAAAQMVTAVEAGALAVSVGSILGPEFSAAPGDMFATDRFHPSAAGYAAVAAALLPSLASALGLWTDEDSGAAAEEEQAILPAAVAAEEAAELSGVEVVGTSVGGRERGPRGRWARLRRRTGVPHDDVPTALRDGSEIS